MNSGFGQGTRRRLFTFGDSLTLGLNSVNFPHGYAYKVAKDFKLDLFQRAVGGTFLEDDVQLGRVLREPITTGDTVVWMVGYNNMRRDGSSSTALNAFEANLRTGLQRLSNATTKVFLGNCLRMKSTSYALDAPYNQGSDTAVASYNTRIATVAGEFNTVTLVDVSAALDPTIAGNWRSDNIHPSDAGHITLANTFEALM